MSLEQIRENYYKLETDYCVLLDENKQLIEENQHLKRKLEVSVNSLTDVQLNRIGYEALIQSLRHARNRLADDVANMKDTINDLNKELDDLLDKNPSNNP